LFDILEKKTTSGEGELMLLEDRILGFVDDKAGRGEIIVEYTSFILSCASKVLKKHITTEDDAFSVSMIAFDEAMVKYSRDKGGFLNFASVVIKNRLTDYLRKEMRHSSSLPFSSLSKDDGEGEELTFEVTDNRGSLTDAALEIRFLNHELERYNISLEDIYKSMPTYSTTRTTCMKIAMHIANSDELYRIIRAKRTLPVKRLMAETGVNEKIFERYRKYIITAVIILRGEYEYIKDALVNSHIKE